MGCDVRALTFPNFSRTHGFAPQHPRAVPESFFTRGERQTPATFPIDLEGEVVLDFGCKTTGRIWIEASGKFDFLYGSDWDQIEYFDAMGESRTTRYGVHETYERACPWGTLDCQSGNPVPLEQSISAFRLLRLRASGRATIIRCWVDFSPPHLPLAGCFQSDDPELETMWQMGVYTTLLCTQKNTDSQVPVPAPGKGYVIWDGPRRDREVWAGDLRLASLIWLSAYDDPEPVANSLYTLWQARHVGCDSEGLIPGSASSQQIFYEWMFWFWVNAWEYFEWTGDANFLQALMLANDLLFPSGPDQSLKWIENHLNPNGFIEATNSWMWSIKVGGEMAALAMVQVAGLEALAKLYQADKRFEQSERCLQLARSTRQAIPRRFYDDTARAFRMGTGARESTRYPLDANAWAVLYEIGSPQMSEACLAFLDHPGIASPAGLRCYWPPFEKEDGDWYLAEETRWMHNETVWPYPNGYAAWAVFHKGRTMRAVEILKAFHRPHIERGYPTLWEVMMPDGDTPISTHGNLGSLCHAWGGVATYLLPRYILGIQPVSP
jgi:hypothetical protein